MPAITDHLVHNRFLQSLARISVHSREIYKVASRFIFAQQKLPLNAPIRVSVSKDKKHLNIAYNPEFFKKVSENHLDAFLIHEALHPILNHLTSRIPLEITNETDLKKRKRYLTILNFAQDLALNQLIPERFEFDQIGTLYPGKGIFKDLPKFKSMDYYWQILKAQYDKDPDQFDQSHSELDMVSDQHDWQEGEELDQELKDIIQNVAQEIGNLGGKGYQTKEDYEKLSQTLFPSKGVLDWKYITRNIACRRQNFEKVSSRRHINRRFGWAQPGEKAKLNKKKAMIAIDCSPSVPDAMLEKFCRELTSLIEFIDCDIIWFSEIITGIEKEVKRRKNFTPVRGGGTDIKPVIEYYNKFGANFDALFIVTDGYFSSVSAPLRGGNNIYFVLPNKQYNVAYGQIKWGHKIYIEG